MGRRLARPAHKGEEACSAELEGNGWKFATLEMLCIVHCFGWIVKVHVVRIMIFDSMIVTT